MILERYRVVLAMAWALHSPEVASDAEFGRSTAASHFSLHDVLDEAAGHFQLHTSLAG